MKIYLDHNVVVLMRKEVNPKLNEIIMEKKKKGDVFLFSPAHLEELAVSERRGKTSGEVIDRDLVFLTDLCENHSIRPVHRDYVEFDTESPRECYKRVLEHYSVNDFVEKIEQEVMDDAHDRPAGDPKEMNNRDPVEMFSHVSNMESLLKILLDKDFINRSEAIFCLQKQSYEIVINRFCSLEYSIGILANWLEKIGYFRESRDNARSRTHDVSHIIYGSYADVIVSGDNKMCKKAIAIYQILGIKTKVVSMNVFVENGGNII